MDNLLAIQIHIKGEGKNTSSHGIGKGNLHKKQYHHFGESESKAGDTAAKINKII